jgi:hypothetical protein
MHALKYSSLFCLLSSFALAQVASLAADRASLGNLDGQIALIATVEYTTTPAALGWEIHLPQGWSFVSISGPNIPEIAPKSGEGGNVELAYTTIPEGRARFVIHAKFPGSARKPIDIVSKAILRTGGELKILKPTVLHFEG